MIGTAGRNRNVKKRFLAGASILMAMILLGTVAACGIPYDYVDENDLSRWIVEFTCDYPSNLPPNGVKYSIQALKEMNLNGNDFTINIPYTKKWGLPILVLR